MHIHVYAIKPWSVNLQGAVTHGDRGATESRNVSRFNIDNKIWLRGPQDCDEIYPWTGNSSSATSRELLRQFPWR